MYIPDVRTILAECARLLIYNGILSMGLLQPAKQCRFLTGLLSEDPYDPDSRNAIKYIHYMDDIFNGVVDAGLSLQRVVDWGRRKLDPPIPVGVLDPDYIDNCGYFIVVAT